MNGGMRRGLLVVTVVVVLLTVFPMTALACHVDWKSAADCTEFELEAYNNSYYTNVYVTWEVKLFVDADGDGVADDPSSPLESYTGGPDYVAKYSTWTHSQAWANPLQGGYVVDVKMWAKRDTSLWKSYSNKEVFACNDLNGSGSCAGYWVWVQSGDAAETFNWTATLSRMAPGETEFVQVEQHSNALSVPSGAMDSDPSGISDKDNSANLKNPWNTDCYNTEGLWQFHIVINTASGQGSFDETTEQECSQPSAVTLASLAAEPVGDDVLVKWSTASELDNVGFDVYRAEDGGARVKLNEGLIAAVAPGSALGAEYQFVDTLALPGHTYEYWLAAIDVRGAATEHGPVTVTVAALRRFRPARPRLAPVAPMLSRN